MDNNLQLLNNTEHRVKFKTGSDINNALINYPSTHALSFNGTDQHGIISNLEINGAFTISMWVKLTDYQSSVSVYPLFLKDYVSKDTTDIFLDIGNAALRASVYDRTGPWATQISCQMAWPPNILPNNTWHHVMMTYDGTTNSSAIKTFINGVESIINVIRDISNESSFNSVNSPADTDAYIGWGNLNNRRFKGEMDQIAIWNSDQSANISSIYTGNTPADLTSLNPDHLFKLNNNTNNSTGASTLSLHSGGAGNSDPHFSKIDLPAKAKDPLVGELLLDKTGDISGVDLDGETRIDTDYTYNGSGEITGSLWIKTNSSKKFIILTDSQSGGYESRFAFGLNGDGNFYVLLGNSGGQQVVHKTSPSSNPLNDGQWHHLVYRVDSSNEATVWVDGVLNATNQINFAINNSIHATSYGSGWADGTAPVYDTWGFDGQLKGLGVWETALTDQQINTIFMSGMDSSVPYQSLSPNLWVGPTGPALYICTDTTGIMSKVTDLTAKMGDVPMLKANANVFTRTSSVSSSGAGFSYSFWFYDDGTETGSQTIFKNDTTHNSHVVVNHDSSIIQFLKHAHSSNIIINNSSIASAITHGYELTYEKNKLNNFLFTKQGADPYFTKLYLNGELVASSDQNVAYYPGALFNEINPKMTNGEEMEFSLLLGDVAYWDADVSDIFDAVYSPNQGHKGYQGDWRNLTVPPKHYWKLGFPLEDGQVKDIGTDGTNHLTTRQPLEETYTTSVYSNDSYLFQPQDGVMHGMSNGQANPYDPEMFMFTGDTINITRPDSSHPLHIKDSSGNDVAVPYTPYSLEFNGTDNYVTMGSPSSLDITGDMTLSIWVNTNQNTEFTALFAKRNGLGRQFYLYLRNDSGNKNVSLQTQPPGGSLSSMNTSGNPITLNTWHHVAAVIKSGVTNGTTIYVDGNAVGTGTMTLASNSTADFIIGSTQGTQNFFDGKLDEAAIFNTALSASDITSIYNSGTPGNILSLNPLGWWRMGDSDSGSGTTITDQGSGGNDGTLVNGPTFSTDVTGFPYITTFSPTTAGTYQYYCTSHSNMIGNINVLQREGYENIFGIDRST